MRKIEIQLAYPFNYTWNQSGDISVISNTPAEKYFALFKTVTSLETAVAALQNADGNYAVVINTDKFLFAAADRVRSFPLFYKKDATQFTLCDNIFNKESQFELDRFNHGDFGEFYCTQGPYTLLSNWYGLPSGGYLFYDKESDELSEGSYFNFDQKRNGRLDKILLKQIYLDTFQSVINDAGDKPLIIPLSGGYDSRCIVACLQLLGAKNIFCYTYGRKNSPEKAVAEKVAKQLNLNWQFVEYTPELLDVFFTDKWENYSDKNHHFTSLPHEQDFFALYALQQKGFLPKNGIVLPGFLGDYFAGSMFKNPAVKIHSENYQDWFISNRGCKFILNSVRVYEYFGLEWRIPFAAKAILEYWLNISLQERFYTNGYNNALTDIFFKPLQINFKKADHEYIPDPAKDFLQKSVPKSLLDYWQALKANNPAADPNNTYYLYQKLVEGYGEKLKNAKKDFNQAHAACFLERLAQKIATLEHKQGQ